MKRSVTGDDVIRVKCGRPFALDRDFGETVTITSVVADLTGRPPRTFPEFARDHAALFRG